MADAPLLIELAGVVRLAAKLPPETVVGGDSRLVEDLGIDSLDLVGLSLRVEEHFDVEIDADAVPGFLRLRDVADYLALRRGAA